MAIISKEIDAPRMPTKAQAENALGWAIGEAYAANLSQRKLATVIMQFIAHTDVMEFAGQVATEAEEIYREYNNNDL